MLLCTLSFKYLSLTTAFNMLMATIHPLYQSLSCMQPVMFSSTRQDHAEPLLLHLVIAAVVMVVTDKDKNAQDVLYGGCLVRPPKSTLWPSMVFSCSFMEGWLCSEVAAIKDEHASELESIYAGANSSSAWRSSESDPQVAALKSRVKTLQEKIQQQSSVIVELMEEVERLAEVENAMSVRFQSVRMLCSENAMSVRYQLISFTSLIYWMHCTNPDSISQMCTNRCLRYKDMHISSKMIHLVSMWNDEIRYSLPSSVRWVP